MKTTKDLPSHTHQDDSFKRLIMSALNSPAGVKVDSPACREPKATGMWGTESKKFGVPEGTIQDALECKYVNVNAACVAPNRGSINVLYINPTFQPPGGDFHAGLPTLTPAGDFKALIIYHLMRMSHSRLNNSYTFNPRLASGATCFCRIRGLEQKNLDPSFRSFMSFS